MAPFESVRFVSTIVAVVGITIALIDRIKAPALVEAEHSKGLPGWVDWSMAALGTIGFIA
jgi:hypothetical protein